MARATVKRALRPLSMDRGMQFENTLRLLFGEKAYQIASMEANPKHRRKWLQKAARELLRTANSLDTPPRHKKILMSQLEAVSEALKESQEASWELVYRLFRVCISLFGFTGARCYTPLYWQTPGQRFTQHILHGNDDMAYQEQKDAISVRSRIVNELKEAGHDDFKISLVLNISEHAVKQ